MVGAGAGFSEDLEHDLGPTRGADDGVLEYFA
jgi:hypothetical protein